MQTIDLRSDTLTMPTPEMRRHMAEAELGDDVYGEDPTVNRLQQRAAEMMGKEAGLFVPSGTMGNLLGILTQARSGQEIIADADSHLFLYEGAGAASLGGIQTRPLATESGVMTPDQIERAIRPRNDDHQPHTAAISIENTHNRHGGTVWPIESLRGAAEVAHGHGIAVHIDGARLFNAAIAQGVEVGRLAAFADTVTFCISKGLGAPIGSVLCGPAENISEARRWRKALGGGWREAGMLAAAGLHALESRVERLADDHSNARTLAEGLAEIDGVDLDLSRVQTNIVIFRVTSKDPAQFISECSARGIKGGAIGADRIRFVTHHGIEPEHISKALAVCSEVLTG